MKNIKVLKPNYFDKFKCIGSSCTDTCCKGWNIRIDENTFRLYKRNTDKELKGLFRDNINRIYNSKNSLNYGKIKLNKNEECPFLDDKKLCKIHSKLGEKYLSNTCKTYPRRMNLVYETLEMSLHMSCPEVARICLLNEKILEFDYGEQCVQEDFSVNYILNKGDNEYRDSCFWLLRIFSIGILQNRNFRLDGRLIILGMAYKKIEEAISNREYKKVEEIIDEFNESIDKDKFFLKQQIDNVSSKVEVQVAIAKSLMIGNVLEGMTNKNYLKNLDDTMKGLGLKGNEQDSIKDIYIKGYNEYYSNYIINKQYILENFLVNEFFAECMPFRFENIWENYMYISVLYTLIKIHLIGISLYRKEINDEITLDLIQSFSRVSIHDSGYMGLIMEFLKENKLDTLAYMAIMVKN